MGWEMNIIDIMVMNNNKYYIAHLEFPCPIPQVTQINMSYKYTTTKGNKIFVESQDQKGGILK